MINKDVARAAAYATLSGWVMQHYRAEVDFKCDTCEYTANLLEDKSAGLKHWCDHEIWVVSDKDAPRKGLKWVKVYYHPDRWAQGYTK